LIKYKDPENFSVCYVDEDNPLPLINDITIHNYLSVQSDKSLYLFRKTDKSKMVLDDSDEFVVVLNH